MFSLFNKFMSLLGSAEDAVDPLYDAITQIGPYAIGVVCLLGMIYSIILGVKYAKAENAQEVEAAKKQLINAIIGIFSIVVLLMILYAIRGDLVAWANGG